MKKFITIIAALLLGLNAFAQKAQDIYRRYSDEKGVSAVYISPAMFRLIGRIPDLEFGEGEVNLAPLIKSMEGMYVLNCENPKVAEKLWEEVKRYIDRGTYELLMEAKDDSDVMRMYTVGDEKVVKSFVMMAFEPGETTFISFEGLIPRDKLEETLAAAASSKKGDRR